MVINQPHFLFIDDHQDTVDLFKVVAEQLGIITTVCSDGAAALTMLDEKEFDAVILDLSMPVLDGLTIAEHIRENEANRPGKKPVCIIFYTGRSIDGAIIRIANRTSVRRIFQKPYDMTEMLEEVKRFCGEPEMIIRREIKQNGHSSPNILIIAAFIVLQIVVGFIFMWLYNKQDVAAAYEFTKMKSERDYYKRTCDTNYLLGTQKDKFIENSGLQIPPTLSGGIQCVLEKK